MLFGGQWSGVEPRSLKPQQRVVDKPQFAMTPSGQGMVTWTQNDATTTGGRKRLWSAVWREPSAQVSKPKRFAIWFE